MTQKHLGAGGLALLVVLTGGCKDRDRSDAPPRQFVAVTWDTLWTAGGTESDSLMVDPFRLATGDGTVYVLQRMASRVVAVDAKTGEVRWMYGRKGNGPGEFGYPAAIGTAPSGEVVVADIANDRLTILRSDGTLAASVPVREPGIIGSVCPLRDGTILVSRVTPGRQIQRLDRTGAIVEGHDVPWPDLAAGNPIPRQAELAPVDGGAGCMVALNLGRGFTRFLPGAPFAGPYRYVEDFDVPKSTVTGDRMRKSEEVNDHRQAATGVAVDGERLVIGFHGFRKHRGRTIDFYDPATGRYLHSYVAPAPVQNMKAHGGTYFFVGTRDGYDVLIAARPRPVASASAVREDAGRG